MVQEVVGEGSFAVFDEVDVLAGFVECGGEFCGGFVSVAGSHCPECGTDSLVVYMFCCAHTKTVVDICLHVYPLRCLHSQ